jgi:hypothetical protein
VKRVSLDTLLCGAMMPLCVMRRKESEGNINVRFVFDRRNRQLVRLVRWLHIRRKSVSVVLAIHSCLRLCRLDPSVVGK